MTATVTIKFIPRRNRPSKAKFASPPYLVASEGCGRGVRQSRGFNTRQMQTLDSMRRLDKVRVLFGWTASPASEFLRFRASAGLLPPLPAGSVNAPVLAELLKKDPEQVTWDEIQAGRIALVEVMPLEVLQAQYAVLVAEYETVTGNKPGSGGGFPSSSSTIEVWRAQVVSLLDVLVKFRRAKLMFERVRSTLGFCFGLPILLLVLAGFWYVQSVYNAPQHEATRLPLWKPLLFAGAVGAGFSVLSRLYSLAWTPRLTAQIEDTQALKKGLVVNCVLSLAEGVIAAGVIYLLFASGLVKGDLFPAFDDQTGGSGSIFMQFLDFQPKNVSDVAKLLAWAFIAGFAERLVPDKLNRLAGMAAEQGPTA